MRRSAATAVAALLVASAGAAVAPAQALPARETARNTLHRDSVYPRHGSPLADTLHYDLDLTWRPRELRLAGVERVLYRGTRHRDRFALDLSDRLHVSASTVDGHPVAFHHRRNRLVIEEPVRKGVRHRLRIEYAGSPASLPAPSQRGDLTRVGFSHAGGTAWTMQEPFGASTWYAANDQPGDKARYDVTLHVPRRWRGIANGRLVADRVREGRRAMRWHLGQPAAAYLTTVAFGRYRVHHVGTVHGVALSYWAPRSMTRKPRGLRHLAGELRWVERRLGRYPFRTLGVVIVPGEGGMETQTMITLGHDAYDLSPGTVVHELAHQWYGDEVTPDDWRDVWMNEGMATYIGDLWQDHVSGHAPGTEVRRNARDDDGWRAIYGPPGDYQHDAFGALNVYDPPATMWQRLRHRLGDTRFWRLVRAWPRSHAMRSTNRRVLARWWSRESGQDLRPFFHAWLMGRRDPS